jgi:hypothetical protein
MLRKKAMGSCRSACGAEEEGEELKKLGDPAGEGAEKRSRGRPEEVMALAEPLALVSEGRVRPPSPDNGASSSANASNEMRSAAFLLGLALQHQDCCA